MVLDGEFSYDDQNQRALPFNVAIQELSEEMTLYVGSKSKSTFFFQLQIWISAKNTIYLVHLVYVSRKVQVFII